MDITTFSGPTPGAALPGNLYADLQSRTLWLGVEAAVDPSQAVLISDIMGLQSDIDGCLADSKAYTDSQITTRAPTVHTHTSSQITDFSSAVTTVVAGIPGFAWVRGMIMQYSGSLVDIGIGQLAGWALCDGGNGTPDLRDRFIVGAGNKVIGAKNTGGLTTDVGGGHDHTVNGTAISIAQMPAHAHGTSSTNSVDHSHAIVGDTGTESADHAHNTGTMYSRSDSGSPVAGSWALGGSSATYAAQNTSGRTAAHTHHISFQSGSNSADHTHTIPSQGGGATHTHTLVGGGGAHTHTVTVGQMREATPYYALAFIMKL
jgi:hypothetical protein